MNTVTWVKDGPDLPIDLIQKVEEGKVVFFCGAGVSRRAGLPDFKGLVEKVYQTLAEQKTDAELKAFDSGEFDSVLRLLENRRVRDGAVRRTVIEKLQLPPQPDLASHRALIELSTGRDGKCRLVTTNFDQGFERVASEGGTVRVFAAPFLPIPKVKAWSGVVHLHGRIHSDDPNGANLVLNAADFGRAYLTEGWASQFVKELFRRYQVVFVGYSVKDAVVRYMIDALNAERAEGEAVGDAYILTEAHGDAKSTWESRGLRPLAYDSANGHVALHGSLERWAQYHRDGLLGKKAIIGQYAGVNPSELDPDAITSQVIWALREVRWTPKIGPPEIEPLSGTRHGK